MGHATLSGGWTNYISVFGQSRVFCGAFRGYTGCQPQQTPLRVHHFTDPCGLRPAAFHSVVRLLCIERPTIQRVPATGHIHRPTLCKFQVPTSTDLPNSSILQPTNGRMPELTPDLQLRTDYTPSSNVTHLQNLHQRLTHHTIFISTALLGARYLDFLRPASAFASLSDVRVYSSSTSILASTCHIQRVPPLCLKR